MILDSFLSMFVTAIIGIFLILYLFIKCVTFTYWKRNGIFQYPQTFPTGIALPLFWERKHMGDFFRDIYFKIRAENRKYAGFYILTKPQLMITDPEDIKHVLATDFNHFRSRGTWYNEDVDPCSANLFCFPADRWKTVRSKLSPFFTPNRLKSIFPTMQACGASLIEITGQYADHKECFDIKDLIWRFTSTILGSCVFGYECNAMKDPNDIVVQIGKDIFEPKYWQALKPALFFLMPKLLGALKISTSSRFVTSFFHNLLTETMAYRDANNVNRADLMQILIDLRQKDSSDPNSKGVDDGLNLNELLGQCWVFFSGGSETSAILVTFCMLELSRNQEIQDKVRNEVLEVLEKHDGKFTFDSLNDMKYTEKVVKETLRKYPPLSFLNRECTSESYTLPSSKITLRKGDSIVISTYGIQRDPEYYPDPDKFDPERFNKDKYVNPYTYLPFGEGPRNCIGLRMGMIQGKLTIALLISKFKYFFNNKTKLPLKMKKNTFTMSVVGGVWLNVERA